METTFYENASVATGVFGLVLLLATLGAGDALLQRLFPRMKDAQRHRIVSLSLMLALLCATLGIWGTVRQEASEPCEDDPEAGVFCF